MSMSRPTAGATCCFTATNLTRYHRWLAVLGDHAYAFAVRLNILLSWARRRLGIAGYWSLAGYAKRRVKKALNFIWDFEASVARHARERGMNGVICGHIHAAAIREVDGIRYLNCGDWVDSCTGIVEHLDGRMELVHWAQGPASPARREPERSAESATSRPASGVGAPG
jgi:UDP-2,3-diacylglucosamine pyrophosphatase LpxH